MKFERPNSNIVPFGTNANENKRFAFGTNNYTNDINENLNDNFKLGWETVGINSKPPRQWFNGLAYTSTYLTSYLFQTGIPEWNENQEYYINSITKGSDGKLYRSLVGTEGSPNVNKNPLTEPNYWRLEIPDRIGLFDKGYEAKPYHIVAFGGEFNRADYPKLWAYLQVNPTLVKTQAQWTTEATANGGICGFYSSGNGTTTFRVPNLNKSFLRPDNRGVGSFEADSMESHNHYLPTGTSLSSSYTMALPDILFEKNAVNRGSAEPPPQGNTTYPNSSYDSPYLVGTVGRFSNETRPKNIAVLPLIVAK
ncbi:hypothetical protein N5915_04460 [Arcobacter lacus]|uniref:hypothetical protein n=1 Tax=Arcobacter lacus TaxID=1912876 RepID=UPI0021BAD463|nr:hypothetical protein [Arcobacter lacus]MCT7908804.1 hypothetical protein [Arcobacter lacus]